jgi:hypothetical protein
MKKEFTTHKQALALKDLGFDEPCIAKYNSNEFLFIGEELPITETEVLAPLKQQVFKWFRKKYELHSTITSISQESWQWHITKPGESLGKLYNEDFYTYEEAESACLDKLIEITKNK